MVAHIPQRRRELKCCHFAIAWLKAIIYRSVGIDLDIHTSYARVLLLHDLPLYTTEDLQFGCIDSNAAGFDFTALEWWATADAA